MHVCEILVYTALGQAPRCVSFSSGVSIGRRCFLCVSSVGAWTDVSHMARDRNVAIVNFDLWRLTPSVQFGVYMQMYIMYMWLWLCMGER